MKQQMEFLLQLGWVMFGEIYNDVICFTKNLGEKKKAPTCSNKILPLATRHLRPRRQPPPAPRKPPQPPATTALEPEGEPPGLHRPLRGGNGGRAEIDGAGDLHVLG